MPDSPPKKHPAIELLAPAGNLATGVIALDSGADAVYAGLARFNARERTENFSLEDFGKLTRYAHDRGRRVHLTLNTLVRQDELADVARLLEDVIPYQPDAVIVQDLGVLRLVRDYFPDVTIHASTQAGTHNSAGVNLLAERGVDRVILQRQIPMEELQLIVQNSAIDIEVFCHGALCCCLSGACLFSSWIGGWSGNRGRCKQPCRRRYFGKTGNGFFFSTHDLYGLEHVRGLRDMGVASLKIEGRLRKSDYVERVVKAYRLMLDCPDNAVADTVKESRKILAGALGRRWTGGFLDRANYDTIIDADSVGGAGQLCGKVTRVKGSGFEMALSQRLHVGDRIRVQSKDGEEGVPMTVTRLFAEGKPAIRGTKGQTCFIPFDRPVADQGLVFRIGMQERDVAKTIAAIPSETEQSAALTVTVAPTGVHIAITSGGGTREWRDDRVIEPARTNALTETAVIDEFSKTPAAGFRIKTLAARIEGDLFLQSRDLRHLRQDFWTWVEREIPPSPPGAAAGGAWEASQSFNAPLPPAGWLPRRAVRVPRGERAPWQKAIAVRSIYEKHTRYDEVVLPDFCPEGGLKDLRQRLADTAGKGVTRFRVVSLFGLKLLSELAANRLEITCAPPLPVTNALAARELMDMGAGRFCAWLELAKGDIDTLRGLLGDRLELYAFGRPPLMTTRAKLPAKGDITDNRGNRFRIVPEGELTRVYPGIAFSISVPEGVSSFFDLTNARLGEKGCSTFNYNREFV
ncbi:MAG: DUF3656 domain-containing protein [Lentisphaeria bacterium]|nr:DUF3656 domain-containing protein [Lentisphaeria bacterium]